MDRVVKDEQGGRAWGTEDDLIREEEAKLIEAERLRMQEETGIYMATNQFDEFEAGSVVRSRDSNILKKIEELYGGMPWASAFTEARSVIAVSAADLTVLLLISFGCPSS